MPRLALASGNPHKVRELKVLLAPMGWDLVPLDSVSGYIAPEETGTTFSANAVLKARALANHLGIPALADDSGLEVDALGGAPGVYSARYCGHHGDDLANNQKLLVALSQTPDEGRTARYRCAIAVALPMGACTVVEGACEGRILRTFRGKGGFGYDPLFELPDGSGRTMAEIGMEEKNNFSHRSRALEEVVPALRALLAAAADDQ